MNDIKNVRDRFLVILVATINTSIHILFMPGSFAHLKTDEDEDEK